MQNRYVGDIGDFGKYGLLRWLLARMPQLRLGVNWYLVPDESHNNDGAILGYLEKGRSGYNASLEVCDPELYERLGTVVRVPRRVAVIESSHVLPKGTVFFSDPLDYSQASGSAARRQLREKWLDRALATTAKCDLVFLDPDNGLECSVTATSRSGPKYAYLDDLEPFLRRRQSLCVYHHISRRGTAHDQVVRQLDRLAALAKGTGSVGAIRYRRGTSRAYLFWLAPQHRDLVGLIAAFARTPWGNHFTNHIP